MKRNVFNSPSLLELIKERRRIFQNNIFLCLLAFLAVFICLVFISRIPSFNISSVEITGNKVTDAKTIREAVRKIVAGNYLWFIPRTNLLFFPENNIKNGLHVQFTRLNDIDMSIKNNRILEISVTEREAKYLWCGATPAEFKNDSNPKCYFLDKDGYIFDEAPYFSGDVYFKFYGAVDSKDIPSGSNFSTENFSKLVSFKETFASLKLVPVALYLQEDGDVRMFLSGKTMSAGPEIIFNIDSDLPVVAENLETALSTEPLQSNFKNKYSSLEYIDLRYGNKVYYKFQ